MVTNNSHELLALIRTADPLRVSFKDSEVYVLKQLQPIDPSTYDSNGQWTALIVELIHVPPEKKRWIKIGTGMDFKEEDIRQIVDVVTNQMIYESEN